MNRPLAIIVLNYKKWEATIKCLESIHEKFSENYYLIVVDNNSSNESDQKIGTYLNECGENFFYYDDPNPDPSLLPKDTFNAIIQTGMNIGYAQGNNVALKFACDLQIPYALILNSDTIISSDFSQCFIKEFKKNSKAAIISPKIVNEFGEVDRNCLRRRRKIPLSIFYEHGIFRPLLRKFFTDKLMYWNMVNNHGYSPTEVVSGSCFMIDLHWFNKMELFDPNTFLYEEEHILAEKVVNDNKISLVSTEHSIVHIGGESTNDFDSSTLKNHYYQSLIFYLNNYRGVSKFYAKLIIIYIKLSEKILNRIK